jgi:hypothetical protein
MGLAEVKAALNRCDVRFVVADCGHPLLWVEKEGRYALWREHVRPRLVEPEQDRFFLDAYPDGRCYTASRWSDGTTSVVLFEAFH